MSTIEVIMKCTKDKILINKRSVVRLITTIRVQPCASSLVPQISKNEWLQIQCKMWSHISQNKHRCVRLCQLIAFLRLHRIFAILNFFAFLSSYFFMDSYIFLYIERSKCTIIYIIIYNNIYINNIIILIYKYKIFVGDITLFSCCPTLPHFPLRYKGKMNSYTRPFHSGSNGCFGLNKRELYLSSTNIYIFYKLYFNNLIDKRRFYICQL